MNFDPRRDPTHRPPPPRRTQLGVKIPPPPAPVIREREPEEDPPNSKRTERIKQIAQAFGWEPLFRGLAMFVGSVAAAALTIRPIIADLRAPAPIEKEHLDRITALETALSKSESERALIATWAAQINGYQSDKVRADHRMKLLSEGLCRVNGGVLGPEWPRCDELWSQLNVKNPAQGHRTSQVW